ncbi:MAG: putative signal peptide peptidase SppA [candidate division BRC1 bacterium ADurb.BinA364]|nr:MAG: putative signal peptide peptidase SppA [candidate division BRC1 bacterium ADurb.BinA364]
MFRQMVEIIAAGRGMDPDSIEATLDMGPFTAEDAKRFGLVDRLAYEEDYILDLAARTGVGFAIEDSEDSPRGQAALQTLNPLDFLKLLSPPQKPSRAIGRDPRIAVVYAVGPILSVDPGDPFIAQEIVTPKRVIGDLRECLADPLVRAIVLRVDSPGGDATASDLIWQEIRRIKKQKPVVASMSDTAASGGYYIAMAADKILAHPGSITGSIGVFGGKLAMGDLLGKIGVTTERIAFGENASIFSSTTPFSETER